MEHNSKEFNFQKFSKIYVDIDCSQLNLMCTTKLNQVDNIFELIRNSLWESIERRITTEDTGIWLSGGINSVILAASLKNMGRKFQTFTVGFSNSKLLEKSKRIADQICCESHFKIITLQEVLKIIPTLIKEVITFDKNVIYSAITNYFLTMFSSEFVPTALNGVGSELLFGQPTNKVRYELEQKLCTIDMFSNLHGVIVRFPFLDNVLIDSLVPYRNFLCLNKNRIRNMLSSNLCEFINAEVLDLQSQDMLKLDLSSEVTLLCNEMISDYDFDRESNLKNGIRLLTKEDLFFYRIFKEQFSSVFI